MREIHLKAEVTQPVTSGSDQCLAVTFRKIVHGSFDQMGLRTTIIRSSHPAVGNLALDFQKPAGKPLRRSGKEELSALGLGESYVLHRPLLLSALSRLSRTGFAVPPDEGLDLVHDFFIARWSAVEAAYDPRKSKFSTYLYSAFVNFARPRIVKSLRWRDALLPPNEIAMRLETRHYHPSENDTSNRTDLKAVRQAIKTLPSPEQEMLLAYLDGSENSERKLAARFSLSRYALRLALSDALARVVVELGERGILTDLEWAFVLALWREKRSVVETARALKRPVREIQEMRVNLFQNLSNAVRSTARAESPLSGERLERAQALLKAALSPEADPQVFSALRENASAILEFLEIPGAEALFPQGNFDALVEVFADAYGALGEREGWDVEDRESYEGFLQASIDEEKSVGEAFQQVLMSGLPSHLTNFSGGIFLAASRVESSVYEQLLGEPSVQWGGPKAGELAQFGITPVTVVSGSQGIANLAKRFCTLHDIHLGQPLILDQGGSRPKPAAVMVLPRELSIEEMTLVSELPEATASRFFDWMTRVAGYARHLFDGFDTQLWGDELRLVRTDVTIDNLFERWHSPPESAMAA
jgi:DNA-directed RNA polymerase specialized sigma24 family protein